MICGKYFKPGQKVLLRTIVNSTQQQCEAIAAQITAVNGDLFVVALPYPTTTPRGQTIFAAGSEFAILSETFGLGIQVSGRVEARPDARTLHLRQRGDYEIFFRREYFRVDVRVGLALERSHASFGSMHQQWSERVRLFADGTHPAVFEHLEPTPVNLSAGGLALTLERPVILADLALIRLDLADGKGLIALLGEVVWTRPPEGNRQSCGLRFAEITRADRDRINDFVVAELKRRGEDIVWYASLRKQLDATGC